MVLLDSIFKYTYKFSHNIDQILQQKFIKIIIILLSIFIVAAILIGLFFPKDETHRGISLLIPDPNHKTTLENKNIRIKYLSELWLQYQTNNAQAQLSLESVRMQTRLSFIALILILLIPFFKTKKVKKRFGIVLTASIFFFSFCFFDIHTADLGWRQAYSKSCFDCTNVVLCKNYPTDSVWYNIDFNILKKWNDEKYTGRKYRKLGNFIRPELS